MEKHEIKEGMRVVWDGNDFGSKDSGVVISQLGSIFKYEDQVWVKWDSDGFIKHIAISSVYADEQTEEQQAIMLLLSLGYTISKN